MSLADRMAIQLELAWTGDYVGVINGDFNERTNAAIRSFQRNRKFRETGILTTQERVLLATAAKARQSQVGWSMVDDPVTGARLGLPAKQVPFKTHSKSGSRWSSAQGQVQVETFRVREPGTTLPAIYERERREPASRKVDFNLLRPDFFVLSGTQGLKRFYVRADLRDGEIRGLTVLYDQATEPVMDSVAAAMAGTFSAFPGAEAITQAEPAAMRKVEYSSGIIVTAAGHILAGRRLVEGCSVIVVSGYGDAVLEAADQGGALALVRIYGVPDLVPAMFSAEIPRGGDLTLLGIADPQSQGGGAARSAVPAKLKGKGLEPAPQLGFSGAGAFDAQGRFVGMVELNTPLLAQVGVSGDRPQATLITVPTIDAFLEQHKLVPASGSGTLEAAKASVVRVICIRK